MNYTTITISTITLLSLAQRRGATKRIAACIFLASSCMAQQAMNNASLSGRLTDISGGIVEGATITAKHSETKVSTITKTDDEGRFRFPYLSVGVYEIAAVKEGFAEVRHSLTLAIGGAYELPLALSVQASVTQVIVTGDGVVLESARSQIAGTVPQTEIDSLPLNGRNFLDVALLMPGVSPTNTASSQLFPETSAVAGQGISVNSQRNFSNSFIVDGLSANDDAAGLSGIPYGVDAVHQFQVVTSGGQAEFGRALGGYINVITRSGMNLLHGNLYGYARHKGLNARNPLSGTKLPLTQVQYGGSLGGPIIRERTFYFANVEQRRLNQSGLVSILPANIAIINSRLDAVGYQGPRLVTGQYSNPVDSTNVLVRGDHRPSEKDALTLRYGLYDVSSSNSRGAGGLNAPSAGAGLKNTDQNMALSNIRIVSSRVVNETRVQFTHSQLAAEPNDLLGPTVTIAGVATFGRLSGSPTNRVNRLYQAVNNLSWQIGSHAVRFGGDFLYNETSITFPRTLRGAYTFSSLANFLSGTYNNAGFTQTFGNTQIPQTNPNAGFYAQDEWKLNSRITLNAGLRYDLQFLETIATDTNNVSPRLGATFTPFAHRRTVVRASYGLFYDRVPLRAVANALLSSGNTTLLTPTSQIGVGLSPAQENAPVFPFILTTAPRVSLVNFTTMNLHLQSAYSVQSSVEVEQQLGQRGTMAVGYEQLRGLHLIAASNRNVPACVAQGTNNGCRPDPSYANNIQYSAQGNSLYHGLHLSFVQRPASWGNYRVSYTYSKSMNNVGEFFFSPPINNFNIWEDWGRSDDDQRHRLVVNGTLHGPTGGARGAWNRIMNGFQLSGTLQYYSMLPLNVTTGTTTVQGTSARPIVDGKYILRNAGDAYDRVNLNARLSREIRVREGIRMEAFAEMFNALNRVNPVTRNGTFGAGAYPSNPLSTFRQITAVADPRSAQLALRVTF